MALIIKGEMPKGGCLWHDEQGKEHGCQFFPCDAIYCLDPEDKKEKCLIIGEIPDKHGRLIDADALPIKDEWTLVGTNVIWDAPTVLEATNE